MFGGLFDPEYPQRNSGVTVHAITIAPDQLRDYERMQRMSWSSKMFVRWAFPSTYTRMHGNWEAVRWALAMGRPLAHESEVAQRPVPAWQRPVSTLLKM